MRIPESLAREIDTSSIYSVSIGYSDLTIFKSKDLAKYQIGYRSDGLTGASLIGDQDGDWLDEWYVIGVDSLCGDPFIVDTSDPDFPVMTAMHGEGAWNPETIAVSLEGFIKALRLLADFAKGREHPVGLESNPISETERITFLKQVSKLTGTASNYWTLLTRNPD